MTEIIYNHKEKKVTVKGHANSGEYGNDLVCAAVSALTCTLAENIAGYASEIEGIKDHIRLDEGDAEIICTECTPEFGMVIDLVFCTICTGFEKLAETYPENVKYTLV
jgi:uncharacterized protein YsxB (DUF464 family)